MCLPGGNDKGGLGCCSAVVVEAVVVACDQHADDQDGQDVEEGDSDKDSLTGSRDSLSGVSCFGCSHGDRLGSGKGEDGIAHDGPESQEFAPVSCANVLDEWARIIPILESNSGNPWDASGGDDDSQNDEEDDEEDLDQGKIELNFAKDSDESDANQKGEEDDCHDPDCRVEIW